MRLFYKSSPAGVFSIVFDADRGKFSIKNYPSTVKMLITQSLITIASALNFDHIINMIISSVIHGLIYSISFKAMQSLSLPAAIVIAVIIIGGILLYYKKKG